MIVNSKVGFLPLRARRTSSEDLPDPEAQLNFSLLPQSLEILHIHVCELDFFEPVKGSLFDCTFPHLRTLILDQINLSMKSDLTTAFWKRHPSIERLEIGEQMYGSWFDTFEDGMLPNLKYLRVSCSFGFGNLTR